MSLLMRLMVRPTRGSVSISSFSMWMIGPSSATKALTGSRTSASYSRRCSSNHGLLLFSASPDKNRNNPAEKPSKRTRFMQGLFGHKDYTNADCHVRAELKGSVWPLSTADPNADRKAGPRLLIVTIGANDPAFDTGCSFPFVFSV